MFQCFGQSMRIPLAALDAEDEKFFRKALGMTGSVTLVLRYDAALAFSCTGQFAAKPNQSAIQAVTHDHHVHNLYYSRTLCLRQHRP